MRGAMGQEVVCTVRWGGRASEGKALLETNELLFRGGDFRLKIPLREIAAVRANDGVLEVVFTDGTAEFEVGKPAERWAKRIANPPTRLDKLGVKPGHRVGVAYLPDPELLAELRARAATVDVDALDGQYDVVIGGVEQPEELARIAALRLHLKPNGGLWIVSPKGRKELRDVDVYAAGKAAGLVDVKVAAYSATHTANKLVIPLAQR